MLEVIYRIYEVADPKTAEENRSKNIEYGFWSSTSKASNIELLMDVLVCDSRDHFKEIIRSTYGEKIPFAYSKKLQPGQLYCIIIGEHCYDTERYFSKIKFTCDHCGAQVETCLKKFISFTDYDIRANFFGIEDYKEKRFCSEACKHQFEEAEKRKLRPDEDQEFWITRDMFTRNVAGYIYLISKKSTGEFYVGQTRYVPIYRWGQHLLTERFPIANIEDYQFEVLEIVPEGVNILEREKHWIHTKYKECPEKSLNIACTKNISEG